MSALDQREAVISHGNVQQIYGVALYATSSASPRRAILATLTGFEKVHGNMTDAQVGEETSVHAGWDPVRRW